MAPTKIQVQATILADRKKVWNFYTNPEHITKWNFASDDWICPSASNDLRVGGKYSARMEATDGSVGFDFEAIYDEIREEEKLAYTMLDGRVATITFKSSGDQTEVTVTFDAENENSVELQKNGWQAILNNCKKYAEGQNLAMKKMQFKIDINASAENTFAAMLGLKNKETYNQWTSEFNPTSTYEGSWDKGNKILFLGTGDDGKRGGMVSRIAENIPNQFVSIQHYGILKGDVEITDGPEVEQWAGGLENYTFSEKDNMTFITVEVDVIESHIEYFTNTFPKALRKLKEMVEQIK